MEFADDEAEDKMAQQLSRFDEERGTAGNRLYYLAVPPDAISTLLHEIGERGAFFKSLHDPWADSTTPHGRLMLTVLGGLAEFERGIDLWLDEWESFRYEIEGLTDVGEKVLMEIRLWGIAKGSGEPNKNKVGKITMKQVEGIAKMKLPDLNTDSLESAIQTVKGTARSMGIEVV